jgi:predicted membrane channel-forming protein YqfA (hemolysin III family)
VGTIIGIGILAYGQILKNDEIKKVALVTFVLMAILTIPVFLTGEEAEETVEHIAGFSEQLIESHEELAEIAIWLMGLLGILSLISFFAIIKNLSFAKTISLITLIVSFGTFGLFAKVGSTGGEIRHSEIRANNVNNDNGIFNSSENEEHDDD